MRRLCFLLFILLIGVGLAQAQTNQISLSFQPSTIFVNVLNTSSFDPVNPGNQPVLTYLNISSNGVTVPSYRLNIQLKWNETVTLLDMNFNALSPLGAGQTLSLTNQDLITQSASPYFEAPQPSPSLDDVMNSSTTLRNALQAGSFPDGSLKFSIRAQTLEGVTISNEAVFVIQIKNVNAIFPAYPGNVIGQSVPKVNMRPVTFLWNTINTNHNLYRLVIKEFVPANPPTVQSVETAGRKVYDNVVGNNLFSEFLPFQDRHFYAWQVSTQLYNENNPQVTYRESDNSANVLRSPWYVFQYQMDESTGENDNLQMMALLNMLNNPAIQAVFNQGFSPTGVIVYEGQVYTGQAAIELISNLLGKNLSVEVKDQ